MKRHIPLLSALLPSLVVTACADEELDFDEPQPLELRAAPANDDIESALVLDNLPKTITQNIGDATVAPTDPELWCQTYERSVWFEYTATSDMQLQIDTSDSGFETAVGVFSDTTTNHLTCDGIWGTTEGTATATIHVEEGVKYHIMIGSAIGGTPPDNFILRMDVSLAEDHSGLALFNSWFNGTFLADTLADDPGGLSFHATVPGGAIPSEWVMGDWNDDGVDTPAYYSLGVFWYTNDIGPTQDWSPGFWFGNAGEYRGVVAGRFDVDYDNDCLGLIHGNTSPVTGDERFALKYWCDLDTLPQDSSSPLASQFLRTVLADTAGFSGTHQFVAGDWDEDGIDEVAVRRDATIMYTLTNPPETAVYEPAQTWGVPSGESPDSGHFVAGDWDGAGPDGWGVVYFDSDRFYYRNDLEPAPTGYLEQTLYNASAFNVAASHRNASGG